MSPPADRKDTEYLTDEQLKGFDNYKYSCIDNSPIAVYVSHPFWNWIVNFYPDWLAPNTLTLGGWALVMGCFLLESVLDYSILRNSVGSPSSIPNGFWLICSICTFLGHTMDGTDGKQARRIGASGPTGELFDHGLDSWSTVPFTITIFSAFGQGEFSVSLLRLLFILISVQVVFIVTHWEKYNTGIMFLSWGYDVSQYGLVGFYLFTWFVGSDWYKFYVAGSGFCFADVLEFGFYVTCALSVAMSVYNIHHAYFVTRTGKQPTLFECLRPLVPVFILWTVSVLWALNSPTNVLARDPRVFFFVTGTVFSNIACELIIAQMTSTRAKLWTGILAVYSCGAIVGCLVPSWELFVLRSTCALITAAHVHYGVCVVRQLCAHFKIYAFDLSYLGRKAS